MNYLQNHIWCSRSNWNDIHYDCRHTVWFNCYEDTDKEDWLNLIDTVNLSVQDRMAILELNNPNFSTMSEISRLISAPASTNRLKPNVMQWLTDNVADRKDADCVKGWCIGNDEYNSVSSTGFSLFFHRKSDAMNFIKQFSIHKKPVSYCQYFSDVRKDLDLKTGKYVMRK